MLSFEPHTLQFSLKAIQLIDYDVWHSIEFGYHEYIVTINISVVSKPRNKWDDNNNFSINAKTMNALYCSLIAEELDCVSTCITAQNI